MKEFEYLKVQKLSEVKILNIFDFLIVQFSKSLTCTMWDNKIIYKINPKLIELEDFKFLGFIKFRKSDFKVLVLF